MLLCKRLSTWIAALSALCCAPLGADSLSCGAGTTIVSRSVAGTGGNCHSDRPAISASGHEVAFESCSTNLDIEGPPISPIGNPRQNIFVWKETQPGHAPAKLEWIDHTLGSERAPLNAISANPRISSDGRLVYFVTAASNFVTPDTNAHADLYRFDRHGPATARMNAPNKDILLADPLWQSPIDVGPYDISSDGSTAVYVSSDGGYTSDMDQLSLPRLGQALVFETFIRIPPPNCPNSDDCRVDPPRTRLVTRPLITGSGQAIRPTGWIGKVVWTDGAVVFTGVLSNLAGHPGQTGGIYQCLASPEGEYECAAFPVGTMEPAYGSIFAARDGRYAFVTTTPLDSAHDLDNWPDLYLWNGVDFVLVRAIGRTTPVLNDPMRLMREPSFDDEGNLLWEDSLDLTGNGVGGVYRWDRERNVVTRVGWRIDGLPAQQPTGGVSGLAALPANSNTGRYVAFRSADPFVAFPDGNQQKDVFREEAGGASCGNLAVVLNTGKWFALEPAAPGPSDSRAPLLVNSYDALIERTRGVEYEELDLLGLTADGASTLAVMIAAPTTGTAELSLSSEDPDTARTDVGGVTLRSVDGGSHGVTLSVPVVGLEGAQGGVGFAYLRAPRVFDSDADSVSRTLRHLVLRTRFLGSGGEQTKMRRFVLERPPVVLVHGIWSDSGVWRAGWPRPLISPGFPILERHTIDYERTHAAPFSVNAPRIADRVAAIIRWRNEMRRIETTGVDYVGHSMGGVLARHFVEGTYPSNAPPYRGRNNYWQGVFNRVVTLNTPWFGADLADLLRLVRDLALTNPPCQAALALVDLFVGCVECGAVDDLRTYASTLAWSQEDFVPNHALVGAGVEGRKAWLEAALLNRVLSRCLPSSVIAQAASCPSDSVVPVYSQWGGHGRPLNAGTVFTHLLGSLHTSCNHDAQYGDRLARLLVGDAQAYAGDFWPSWPAGSSASERDCTPLPRSVADTGSTSGIKPLDPPPVDVLAPASGATFESSTLAVDWNWPAFPASAAYVALVDWTGRTVALTEAGAGGTGPGHAVLTLERELLGHLRLRVAVFGTEHQLAYSEVPIERIAAAAPIGLSLEPAYAWMSAGGSTADVEAVLWLSDGRAARVDWGGAQAGGVRGTVSLSSRDAGIAAVDATGRVTSGQAGLVTLDAGWGPFRARASASVH